jgi:hypothetical protein
MDLFNLNAVDLVNYEEVKEARTKDPIFLQFLFSKFDINDDFDLKSQIVVSCTIAFEDLGDLINELR